MTDSISGTQVPIRTEQRSDDNFFHMRAVFAVEGQSIPFCNVSWPIAAPLTQEEVTRFRNALDDFVEALKPISKDVTMRVLQNG